MIEKQGEPVGYVTRPLAKRMTRTLHARRKTLREEAEAVFAPKLIEKPIECPTKN